MTTATEVEINGTKIQYESPSEALRQFSRWVAQALSLKSSARIILGEQDVHIMAGGVLARAVASLGVTIDAPVAVYDNSERRFLFAHEVASLAGGAK